MKEEDLIDLYLEEEQAISRYTLMVGCLPPHHVRLGAGLSPRLKVLCRTTPTCTPESRTHTEPALGRGYREVQVQQSD